MMLTTMEVIAAESGITGFQNQYFKASLLFIKNKKKKKPKTK